MSRALSADYLSLLIAVQENPLGTIDDLAKRVGISKPTATKRLEMLHGRDKYFVVNPLLDYHNLGLEAVDLLVEVTDHDSILLLEKVARAHPYTAYRGRCYGSTNGLLLQFRVPNGSTNLVIELIDTLQKRGVISTYHKLADRQERAVFTSMKIDGWDANTMTWKFDWSKWFKKSPVITDEPLNRGSSGKALKWLAKSDAFIIEELMRGSRRKNVDIIQALGSNGVSFTPQTFGRHYKMVCDDCFHGYRVSFNPETFDIYNNLLVVGTGDEGYLQKMRTRLREYPIPFESTFQAEGNKLFWFLRLQASHVSPMLSHLHSNLYELQVSVIDYLNTMLYYLWPETFDDEKRKWRDDRQFMVTNVLDSLE